MDYEEILDEASGLASYYSDLSGHVVETGALSVDEIWISSRRTNGREYFEDVRTANDRLEQLYQEYIQDFDDDRDPLAELW